MRFHLPIAAATLALFGMLAVSPLTAAAASNAPTSHHSTAGMTQAIATPLTTATGSAMLTGTLTINRVVNQGGQLMAVGTISGVVSNATGALASLNNQAISQAFTAPLADPGSSCPILHLVIGPINLNLLGLVVTTNQIVVDITAVPGAGNLLGNLLCAVVHLLDNTSASMSAVAALLNNIIGILGSLGL